MWVSCPMRAEWLLGWRFPCFTPGWFLITHVEIEPSTRGTLEAILHLEKVEGFEPLTKDSRSSPLTMVALQYDSVWVGGKRVECRDSWMEVDILEFFVEVDSCSGMLSRGGEIEHEVEVGYGTCLGVQDAKATCM